MIYTQLTYQDKYLGVDREYGVLYFGITDPEMAIKKFREEYPEKVDKELTVKVYMV
jgi:hypothetical protein